MRWWKLLLVLKREKKWFWSEMKKRPLISLRAVSKHYQMDGVTVKALTDVSLKIFSGDLVTIVGASGSGKSTLLHLLGLLDKPTKGEVVFQGKRVDQLREEELARWRNREIGFVFQQFNLLPRTTVIENVLLPLWYNPNLSLKEGEKKARKLLEQFGLGKRLFHFPNQLSGGEQQRVAIIRALICDPQLILADEPTGNLDSKTGKEIIDLLIKLNLQWGKSVVLVTHDLSLARLGRRRIFLKDGKIVKEER